MKKAIIIGLSILMILLIGCTNKYPCEISIKENRLGITHRYTGKFAKLERDNNAVCCVIDGYSGDVNKAVLNDKANVFCATHDDYIYNIQQSE